jgi:hypothetical protein
VIVKPETVIAWHRHNSAPVSHTRAPAHSSAVTGTWPFATLPSAPRALTRRADGMVRTASAVATASHVIGHERRDEIIAVVLKIPGTSAMHAPRVEMARSASYQSAS